MYGALQNVGKTVLFIKDNKVIGKGSSQIGHGDDWHGIRVESGEIFDQLKDLAPFNSGKLGIKHSYIRFSPLSGVYLGMNFSDEYPEVDALLEMVRVVDEFNFGYRMAPDSFKEVEGYGVAAEAWKKDINCIVVFEMKDWRETKPENQLVMECIARNDVTHERVLEWAQEFGMVDDPTKLSICFYFENKDCVWLHYSKDTYHQIGEIATLQLGFTEMVDENDKLVRYSTSTQYFWPGYVEDAIGTFVSRLRSENPVRVFHHPKSEKLEMIRVRNTKELKFENHYRYLDAMLEPFWKLVFDKTPDQMYCGGIIISHGDKGYGYKDTWEKAGIRYDRGMLLYLLTYTKELGDRPKHESEEWVIENYPKYLERIEMAEKSVLKEVFDIE